MNKVLREIFGSEGKEVTGRRKLPNAGVQNL